jgi:hypothetical protein
MKAILTYKSFNGEEFILMATFSTKEEAVQKISAYRSKYGRARIAKTSGKFGIFCCQ